MRYREIVSETLGEAAAPRMSRSQKLIAHMRRYITTQGVNVTFTMTPTDRSTVALDDLAATTIGSGNGTVFMTELMNAAHRFGVSVELEALWQGKGGAYTAGYRNMTKNQKRLVNWYTNFGFEEVDEPQPPAGVPMRLEV